MREHACMHGSGPGESMHACMHACARALPTALAAPVEEGMMLAAAPRPPRQSFLEGPSTVFCVAVVACTVVIRPSTMSKFSCTT